MQEFKNKKLHFEEGVYVSEPVREKFKTFEESYLALRNAEKRILSTEQIKDLPFPKKNSPDYQLWHIRRKNIFRVLNHLAKKKRVLNILDIGCGNGFFTNMMAQQNHKVFGLDVNLTELKQAAKAFPSSGITWLCIDILTETPEPELFDVITFCTSFQYFAQPKELLTRCKQLLKPGGEIHIIDSPFYTQETHAKARENSRMHFEEIGVTTMMEFYHHHSLEVLEPHKYHYYLQSKTLLKKLLGIKESPFPWIIIQ